MDIEDVWPRVKALAGEEFRQKGGKPFTYTAHANYLRLDTTNRNIPRTAVARAVERMPIEGPGQLNDLSAPSYLYAIVTDPRVGVDGSSTTVT